PPSTLTQPAWIVRAPEINASRLDLPTPSGPMKPSMQAAGRARSTASTATVWRYPRGTPEGRATQTRGGMARASPADAPARQQWDRGGRWLPLGGRFSPALHSA